MSDNHTNIDRRDFLTSSAIGAAMAVLAAKVSAAETANPKRSGMKITRMKTYMFNVSTGQTRLDPKNKQPISSPFKTWLFLKLETNAGLSGWGEGSGEWISPIVRTALHQWEELLIGRDPLDVTAICDDITNRLPWKGGPILGSAVAAVNMALYDIAGKALKVPVHRLLGGRQRDRILIYDNGGLNFDSIDKARKQARTAVEAGARGLKGNPLEGRTWAMDRRELEKCVAIVKAVREEVGPEIELLLDTHGSPAPELSIAFARMVAPYHPLFLEEPCKVGSVEVLKEISEKSPVPIATGEKLFSYRDFKAIIDARACAYLQPDISHSFGIDNFLHISRLADDAQMLMAPHNASGPIHFAALLQADAVLRNFLIQEVSGKWFHRFDEFIDHEFRLKEGFVNLPDRPGLGIEVKENDIAKLPYDKRMTYRQYRHADGSWKGW
jgi:galactonate dehydratase